MFYKKFIFVKEFSFHGSVLPKGTEVSVVNEAIYVNGGQITPGYYEMFHELVQNELLTHNHEFLKEVPIPYNKV